MDINQNTVSYTLEGDGAETVVLVHGELNEQTSWLATVAALKSNFRVLRYDREPRPGASLQEYALELCALLDALEIGSFHIVGHSGGGLVALRVVALKPERALTLTLADTPAALDKTLEAKVKSVLAALDAGGPSLALKVATPWLWGSNTLETRADWLAGLNARAERADPARLRASLEHVLGYGDQRKWLRVVQCPTLVMVGSDDALTPLRYSHEIVEWIKPGYGVLVTITGGGHNAPLEKPDEFNRVLAGLLTRYQEFVAGPSDWQDESDEDDGAEFHDYDDPEKPPS
jgi:pimeloyl-ACP methyl ester carboxylesterase